MTQAVLPRSPCRQRDNHVPTLLDEQLRPGVSRLLYQLGREVVLVDLRKLSELRLGQALSYNHFRKHRIPPLRPAFLQDASGQVSSPSITESSKTMTPDSFISPHKG